MYVFIRQPAETFVRSQIKQGSMGSAASSPHNTTQQLPKQVIVNALRSSLYPSPNAILSSPHLQRSAKRKKTCNGNMQMKRPPQKL
jgi:hypothetical protein